VGSGCKGAPISLDWVRKTGGFPISNSLKSMKMKEAREKSAELKYQKKKGWKGMIIT